MVAKATAKRTRRYTYRGDPLVDPPPAELMKILDRYRGQADALIAVLEEIQAHFGFLPQRNIQYTARELGFPLSQVFGIATFYNLFQLSPPGRHLVRICKGTACYVNKSSAILTYVEDQLKIGEDETTPDGLFTLQTVACVGACSLAPVVVIDHHAHGRMTPEETGKVLAELQTKGSTTDKEVEV